MMNRLVALVMVALVAAPAGAQEEVFALPPGSVVAVQLASDLSSRDSFPNDTFTAYPMSATDARGEPIDIPSGLAVTGVVAARTSAAEVGALARLTLRFDRLTLADGTEVPITLALVPFVPEGDAWRITTVAGGTVIIDRLRFHPALRGVLVDRSRDVAIAGIAAGGAGTLVAPAPGREVEVESGAIIELRLQSRLSAR